MLRSSCYYKKNTFIIFLTDSTCSLLSCNNSEPVSQDNTYCRPECPLLSIYRDNIFSFTTVDENEQFCTLPMCYLRILDNKVTNKLTFTPKDLQETALQMSEYFTAHTRHYACAQRSTLFQKYNITNWTAGLRFRQVTGRLLRFSLYDQLYDYENHEAPVRSVLGSNLLRFA